RQARARRRRGDGACRSRSCRGWRFVARPSTWKLLLMHLAIRNAGFLSKGLDANYDEILNTLTIKRAHFSLDFCISTGVPSADKPHKMGPDLDTHAETGSSAKRGVMIRRILAIVFLALLVASPALAQT